MSTTLTDVSSGPSTVPDSHEWPNESSLSDLHKAPPADPKLLLPVPKVLGQVLGLVLECVKVIMRKFGDYR